MEKVNFWKLLGIIGTLTDEVNVALAGDLRIDAIELVKIGKSVVKKLELPMTEESTRKIDLIMMLMEDIVVIAEDKKVTVQEIIDLGEKICVKLGIQLDKTGFTLK